MAKKIGFLVLLIILCCVLFACIVIVYWWNQPLGEGLKIPSPTLNTDIQDGFETEIPAIIEKTEEPNLTVTTPAHTATTVAEDPPNDGVKPMYILAAGIDSTSPGYRGGLADVIRIVRVDFESPKVTVLTLPRDLWVELPGIKEELESLTHGKLNTAYTHGIPHLGRYEGEGGGPGLLAHTIAHNYGLVVDHYAVINMEVFVDIVDALDGIDLYLDRTWDGRADTDNPDHDAWVFEEGEHHMKGAEALRFSRIRLNYSEITRTDNQTLVICAVKEKMIRPSVFTVLPSLVEAFYGRVQTDLSPAQISQLISLLPKLGPENLLFIRFPNDMFVQGRAFDPLLNNTTFIWDIPVEDIRQFIRDFEQDTITSEIGGGGGRVCP